MKVALIILILISVVLAMLHSYRFGYNNGAKDMVNAIDDELENIKNEKENNKGDNEKQEDTQSKD